MGEISKDSNAAVWQAGLKPIRGMDSTQEHGAVASGLTGEIVQHDVVVGRPGERRLQPKQLSAVARRSVGGQLSNSQQGPIGAPDNIRDAIAPDMATVTVKDDQAIFTERVAEISPKLSDIVPVYSQIKFFDLVSISSDFRNQIAGVTGTSVSHIIKGFDPRGTFSFPLYHYNETDAPYIRMLLTPQLTDKVLDEESGFGSIDEIITVASQYSNHWALREILAENGFGSLSGKNVYADHINATFFNELYSPPTFIRSSQEEVESRERLVREERLSLFGSQEIYDDIINQTRQREGVLAIYGDATRLSGFLEELIGKGKLISGENADQNTAKIYEPVPSDLIMALVPMGEYEEAKLLNR